MHFHDFSFDTLPTLKLKPVQSPKNAFTCRIDGIWYMKRKSTALQSPFILIARQWSCMKKLSRTSAKKGNEPIQHFETNGCLQSCNHRFEGNDDKKWECFLHSCFCMAQISELCVTEGPFEKDTWQQSYKFGQVFERLRKLPNYAWHSVQGRHSQHQHNLNSNSEMHFAFVQGNDDEMKTQSRKMKKKKAHIKTVIVQLFSSSFTPDDGLRTKWWEQVTEGWCAAERLSGEAEDSR